MLSAEPGPAPHRWQSRVRRSGWEVEETWCASLCHRPRDGLDIDQKRLVFRRLDVGVTDVGRERIGPETLARSPRKAPVQRDADDVHRLSVALDGKDTLGAHGLCRYRAALRRHPHPTSRLDALLLRERLADLDEEL